MKEFLIYFRQLYRDTYPMLVNFVLRNVRIVAPKAPTCGDIKTNCRKAARSGDFKELHHLQPQQCDDLLRGKDVKVSTENWEIPMPESKKQTEKFWNEVHMSFTNHFDLDLDMTKLLKDKSAILCKKSFGEPISREWQAGISARNSRKE